MNDDDPQFDQQLDDLLGDVRIPANLKDSLRQIPDLQAPTNVMAPPSPKRHQAFRHWTIGTLLAASIAIVAAVISARWKPDRDLQAKNDPVTVASPDDKNVLPAKTQNPPIDNEVAQLMAQLQQNDNAMEAVRLSTRTRNLKQELSAFNLTRSPHNRRRSMSIILGLASQTAIEEGASFKSVRQELVLIAKEYDGTRGAEIATSLLNRSESTNEF